MDALKRYLTQEVDSSEHQLEQLLIPVVASCTGVSQRGYPYFQQETYRLLRDTVPHILGMGHQTIESVDYLVTLVDSKSGAFSEDTLGNFRRATEVVRAVVRTAAITAPSDLWLLHHVLSAMKRHELLDGFLAGEELDFSHLASKGFLPSEIQLDLRFLVSRGILYEDNGAFGLTSSQEVSRLLSGISDSVPGGGVRLSALWASALREPSKFKQWEVLQRAVCPKPRRKEVTQDSWVPTLEEVQLGFQLVPLVLALHVSGIKRRLLTEGGEILARIDGLPNDIAIGAVEVLQAAGILATSKTSEGTEVTWVGRRVLERGVGPFGIIEAYHSYMTHLSEIWSGGKKRAAVSRGTNIAASQLANARSFEKANDAIDEFCRKTGHEVNVFIEHALGRGEASRQRFERLKQQKRADQCAFIGADLEDPAIDAAMEEQRLGKLPSWMKFVRNADIGQPRYILDSLAKWKIKPQGAFMVVGNGFHEVRNQTDESITAVFNEYCEAGIIIVFTEESALMTQDLIETAWNTYHAGFKYVHERSGQVLRPAESNPEALESDSLRSSWAECAKQAGYLRIPEYCSRTRTIFPYRPRNGRNPAISVNHFLVPEKLAQELGILSS